jgi:hypothetical protein
MSRSIVRGLTAAIVLVTVFCFAMPAVAAPARSHSRIPVVLGPGLFDQVFSWLNSLLPDQEAKPQSSWEKSLIPGDGTTSSQSQTLPTDPTRGAQIDPNGLH